MPIVFFYIITLSMPSALEIRMKDCMDSFMSSVLLNNTTFTSSWWTSLSAPLSNCVGDSLIQRGIKEKKEPACSQFFGWFGDGSQPSTTDSDLKATAFVGDLSDTLGV